MVWCGVVWGEIFGGGGGVALREQTHTSIRVNLKRC